MPREEAEETSSQGRNSLPAPVCSPPPSLALPPEPTRAAKRRRDPRSIPPGKVCGPPRISTSLNPSLTQAALPPRLRGTALGSRQGPLGEPGTTALRGRLRWKARESQEAALPRHSRRPTCAVACPQLGSSTARPGASESTFPSRPAAGPTWPRPGHSPAPAPGWACRRLLAPRGVHTGETRQKGHPGSERADGRYPRSSRAAPKRRPEPPERDAGGGGARARSPAGEQRGAGMGPRASWVSGDRSAGGRPRPGHLRRSSLRAAGG